MSEPSLPRCYNPFLVLPCLTGAGYFYASFRISHFPAIGSGLPVTGGALFVLFLWGLFIFVPGGYLLIFIQAQLTVCYLNVLVLYTYGKRLLEKRGAPAET